VGRESVLRLISQAAVKADGKLPVLS